MSCPIKIVTANKPQTNTGAPLRARVRSPLAGWMGGKASLAKTIIPMIPEHTCYVEPFAGAGWILFSKEPSKAEILNDINSDIVTLYRVIKYHLEEFCRQFKWMLVSRENFRLMEDTPPATLTDIQRAARFYYLHRQSFAGRINNRRSFGYSTTDPPKINLLRMEEDLSEAHLRISQTTIEHLSYGDVIRRYDRPHTFFYVDPPYWDCEDYYGPGIFGKEDFAKLADQLTGIGGKFLMSINDVPEIRELFKAFHIQEVPNRYSCHVSSVKKVVELLIKNY